MHGCKCFCYFSAHSNAGPGLGVHVTDVPPTLSMIDNGYPSTHFRRAAGQIFFTNTRLTHRLSKRTRGWD